MRIGVVAIFACLTLVAASCGTESEPTGADAADGQVTEAAGDEPDVKRIVTGETGGVSFSRLPAAVTRDRLNEEGWEIETVNFSAQDLILEAVSSGTVDIARFQVLDGLRAKLAGANITFLASDRPDEFVAIAPAGTNCADHAGDRLASHSESSTYTFVYYHWLENNCGVDPDSVDRLFISGGENRIVALMNGEIDGTNVQLADFINLENLQPGKFEIQANFGQEIEGLVGGVLVANTTWLENNRALAVEYVAEVLKDLHDANADGTALRAAAETHQSDDDVAVFDTVREAYMERLGGVPECGLLTQDVVTSVITLFEDLDIIEPGLNADELFDASVLEEAQALVDHC